MNMSTTTTCVTTVEHGYDDGRCARPGRFRPLPQWTCAGCQRRVVSRAPWQTPPRCRECRARETTTAEGGDAHVVAS